MESYNILEPSIRENEFSIMKITVFTPTYNRAYIIENLYRSLQRQTVTCFEWLVVDDGSTDNTAELFCTWQQEGNAFPIRYYRQENGGKCRAINRGMELAEGELFFTVDSDDYLTDDALEKVLQWEKELPKEQPYCGFAGNLGTARDETPNRMFDESYYDGTALDRYGAVDGERAMVFYTDIHRKYLYPVFADEKFMTEAVAWNRMAADGYKMRFYNDIIWIYEYREDGLTKAGNSIFLDNPRGYGLWLRERAQFQNVSAKEMLKMYYTFTCDLSGRLSAGEIAQCIGAPCPLIVLLNTLHKLIHFFRK